MAMADDHLRATRVLAAPINAVFDVLADPARHAVIDGTGRVRDNLDREPLTAPGQVFRMAMYHPEHPDGDYLTANRVQVLEPPHAISWQTGYDAGDGALCFDGWFWRYDLEPAGPSSTIVTLTYDWSATSEATRELIGFPPFPPQHLDDSLAHLAGLIPRTCGCEPDLGPNTYARTCDYCATSFAGRHCVHDAAQDPCPECDVVPPAQFA
jgi:uncharacterized protein YndB with AHSA1/START domain